MSDRPAAPLGPAQKRQPLFNIPRSVAAVLVVLVGIHLARQFIPDGWDDALFTRLVFVPGRLTYFVDPDRVVDAVVALAGRGAEGYRLAQQERSFLIHGGAAPWTTVTYALLHGDWAHIGLNGVFLLAFGTPVARRFGAWRFFAFLAVAAWAGAMAYWAANPLVVAPVLGASAAVSGCMGATLRFMFQPDVAMADIVDAVDDGRRRAFLQPARSLRGLFGDSRAVAFLVAWFATNLLLGLGAMPIGLSSGPIAWEAHIGGFLAGLLLFPLFDPLRRAESSVAAPSGQALP